MIMFMDSELPPFLAGIKFALRIKMYTSCGYVYYIRQHYVEIVVFFCINKTSTNILQSENWANRTVK